MQPELKEFEIDKSNIENFIPIEGQRAVRKTQVLRLERAMFNGSYISTEPIYVNDIGQGQFRVIDGNHRIIAISNLLRKRRTKSIKITLGIFSGLSAKKEKEVYDTIARQLSQSINDLLNLHKNEFPLWKLICKKAFPVKTTIYTSKTGLLFKIYLHMLFSTSLRNKKYIAYMTGRDELVEIGKNSTEEDFDALHEFFMIFVSVFGEANSTNRYCKQNFLLPLYYIWTTNQDIHKDKNRRFKRDFWIRKFEKIIGKTRIIELCALQGSRENRTMGRELILKIFNDFPEGRTSKKRRKDGSIIHRIK